MALMRTEAAEIHYEIEGPEHAPVVVLSNSLGTTMDVWDRQLPALRRHLRVLRYDQRGHGGSAAIPGPYSIDGLGRDVVDLLDGLGIESASFCGLSLGASVGMWLAASAPDRVDRLVLCCGAPWLGPAQPWVDRAAAVRSRGVEVLVPMLPARWFTAGFVEREAAVVAEVVAMLSRVDAEGYAGCCEAIAAMDLRPSLAGIGAPTLVVAGAEDPVAPPEATLALQAAIPGASLVLLGDASHMPNFEHPASFTALVLDHIAGGATERGDAVRRQVLGDGHVERSIAGATPFTSGFQDLITRYAWGEIWARPGLDRRTRSCVTLAMLAALGRTEELVLHLTGARRNGLSDEEIAEVLLQVAIYAGVPAANSAFGLAKRVLSETGSGLPGRR